MDFIAHWSERTEIRALQLVDWIGLSRSKYYSWRDRYGKANEHNALVPRDHWLEPWEKVAIISFHHQFPLECVGCNKASNRIWRRQGGRCFLITVDLLAARGSPRVALEDNLHLRPFCGSGLSSGMFLAFLFGVLVQT